MIKCIFVELWCSYLCKILALHWCAKVQICCSDATDCSYQMLKCSNTAVWCSRVKVLNQLTGCAIASPSGAQHSWHRFGLYRSRCSNVVVIATIVHHCTLHTLDIWWDRCSQNKQCIIRNELYSTFSEGHHWPCYKLLWWDMGHDNCI